MKRAGGTPDVLRFGPYSVVMNRRELLHDGQAIELGGRAFDLLAALIEGRGMVLSNEALMSRVWPGRVVEGNSLHAHVSALRRALAADRTLIRTVSGRGYQFTGVLAQDDDNETMPTEPLPAATNLPEPVSELIGRERELNDVAELLLVRRLVTLVGTGGIGKTRLSLEVARNLQPRFANGVWIAELGALADPELVAPTVAAALGLAFVNGDLTRERIASVIGGRQLLLILDNCEHLIDTTARVAEMLLQAGPQVSLLATSREPLRIAAEAVYRVPPLEVPADDTASDTGRAQPDVIRTEAVQPEQMQTGAMRLFVARTIAAQPGFVPDAQFLAVAAAVCRRLDGIPLAIELAAVRSATLGIEALAERLDDRFRVLTGGRRTALPRHQTLRAAIDWSFDLLQGDEQLVLRRLAVFAGGFSLEAASSVVRDERVSELAVADHLGSLVAKSLVVAVAEAGGASMRYQLRETMRAYALDKLNEAGERLRCARLHAAYYCALMERAALEAAQASTAAWLGAYSRQLDNVRAALAWAFSPEGDSAVGEALTVATIPLWMQLSLVNECRKRVQQALANGTRGLRQRSQHDMKLYSALGSALVYTSMGPQAQAAWTNALEIAEALGDVDYKLRSLWGLWVDRLNSGELRQSLAVAQRFHEAAADSSDPNDAWIGERVIGISMHFLGEQTPADRHIVRMIDNYAAPPNRSDILRFQFDPLLTARCFHGRIRWLQGYADQALHIVEQTIADAQSQGHALSLVNSLGQGACLVAFYAGELSMAERFAAMLLDHSARHGIALWHAWGRCFSAALLARRGDVAAGLRSFRTELTAHPETRKLPRYLALLGELARLLGEAGEVAEGLSMIDMALSRSERCEERWCIAELLRIKGELLRAAGDAGAAGEHFEHSLRWARQQQTLSWELRSTMSLARWHADAHRHEQAHAALSPVYQRFTEGFDSGDLVAARSLLAQLV